MKHIRANALAAHHREAARQFHEALSSCGESPLHSAKGMLNAATVGLCGDDALRAEAFECLKKAHAWQLEHVAAVETAIDAPRKRLSINLWHTHGLKSTSLTAQQQLLADAMAVQESIERHLAAGIPDAARLRRHVLARYEVAELNRSLLEMVAAGRFDEARALAMAAQAERVGVTGKPVEFADDLEPLRRHLLGRQVLGQNLQLPVVEMMAAGAPPPDREVNWLFGGRPPARYYDGFNIGRFAVPHTGMRALAAVRAAAGDPRQWSNMTGMDHYSDYIDAVRIPVTADALREFIDAGYLAGASVKMTQRSHTDTLELSCGWADNDGVGRDIHLYVGRDGTSRGDVAALKALFAERYGADREWTTVNEPARIGRLAEPARSRIAPDRQLPMFDPTSDFARVVCNHSAARWTRLSADEDGVVHRSERYGGTPVAASLECRACYRPNLVTFPLHRFPPSHSLRDYIEADAYVKMMRYYDILRGQPTTPDATVMALAARDGFIDPLARRYGEDGQLVSVARHTGSLRGALTRR